MQRRISQFLDVLSEYFANRKGLIPIIGLLLVFLNMVLRFVPGMAFISETELLLHLGVIVAVLGILLAWAL
jgi:TRAP-type C4-dicarboxylate transport system permease small subunit